MKKLTSEDAHQLAEEAYAYGFAIVENYKAIFGMCVTISRSSLNVAAYPTSGVITHTRRTNMPKASGRCRMLRRLFVDSVSCRFMNSISAVVAGDLSSIRWTHRSVQALRLPSTAHRPIFSSSSESVDDLVFQCPFSSVTILQFRW